MHAFPWEKLVTSASLLTGIGCTPTLDFAGQYMALLDDQDIGLGIFGQLGVFPPGDSQPTQRDTYEPITLPNNQLTGLMRHPGGEIPATFLATLLDTDADLCADRIDMILTYPDTHTVDLTMHADDAYEDHRCWLGHSGPAQAATPPSRRRPARSRRWAATTSTSRPRWASGTTTAG
ncbi:MAG: hypothetical protein IPK07_23515 [Deltaproteobacteria bacterium]|nr:hypothetical protein [Deltaproteobacteria bacterium]